MTVVLSHTIQELQASILCMAGFLTVLADLFAVGTLMLWVGSTRSQGAGLSWGMAPFVLCSKGIVNVLHQQL